MITFLAPASMCLAASAFFVNRPVDSITTSAPASAQGSAAGSRSAKTLSSSPSTISASSVKSTSPGKGPRIESYLSRCASVFVSVMSLTPTQSMSSPRAWAARNTLRPMRPKPLMPAFKAIRVLPFVEVGGAAESISGPPRRLVDVAVHDVDQLVAALLVYPGEVLRDHDGAMAPTGAPDPHREV